MSDDKTMTAEEKLKAIRELFREELAVYPGFDAMRIIDKVLDIMNDE